jgi:type IV pilus biogenesis protein CpaD/CtpE
MRNISSMLLGGALLLGAGCSQVKEATKPGDHTTSAKERLVSTKASNATWDHILEGESTLTAVRTDCKEGTLSMYITKEAVCPAVPPSGAQNVTGQNQFSVASGEHLCAAVEGGEGPCNLLYQSSASK